MVVSRLEEAVDSIAWNVVEVELGKTLSQASLSNRESSDLTIR